MDSRQNLEEILKEIKEQEDWLTSVKASKAEAQVCLDESNESSQKILEEKRAIQARIDGLLLDLLKR